MFHWTENKWNYLAVCIGEIIASFACFFLLQFTVRWYLFGKCTFKTFSYFAWRPTISTVSQAENEDFRSSQSLLFVPPNKKWRISNEVVSLIHSVISGLWALYSCIMFQDLINDLVHFKSQFCGHLILLSTGYLIHDLIDLVVNERSLRIVELIFHHIVVLIGFATTFITGFFMGVVVLGLLMEINSIFLHSRSLLNLYGVDKKSTAFRIIALLNITTYMPFRMVLSVYLIYWQLITAWSLYWVHAVITFFVILSLAVTNTVLCYRVLAADGLLGKKRSRRRIPLPPREEEEEGDPDNVVVSPGDQTTHSSNESDRG
ncbi:hypothetical protein AB6A40_008415 [Gnathostoma spinigerum]|uniref:TLC domain-containing protein n=1 Tax=Gnathostoma spinigerum TaxID=75299 RepID=A0ABD6EQX2_9BILA